jgi:hypothetical protein
MTRHRSRTAVATSALLVVAGAFYVLGAWERWGAVCSFGPDDSSRCVLRGDGRFDPVLPESTGVQVGSASQLIGLAMLLIAVALALMPAALGRRTTGFTRPVLAAAVLVQASAGALTLVSGLRGRGVDLPQTATFLFSALLLPCLVGLALLIPDGDDRRAGLRGGLVGWMLIGTTPMIQLIVAPAIGGIAVDASPWSEVMVAPFLLVAAVALLAGTRRQRAFSNQHLAHSLSL